MTKKPYIGYIWEGTAHICKYQNPILKALWRRYINILWWNHIRKWRKSLKEKAQ